jgi:hypothetical protein
MAVVAGRSTQSLGIIQGTMNLPASAQRYAGEPFHHFGVNEAIFSWDERNPTLRIRLGHFKIPGAIEIAFSDVAHHSVMSESYIYAHAEDHWAEQSFIAEATTSQLQAFLARYTLLESMRSNAADLRHFRVIAQNFFIEVLTGREPVITVRDDA